MLFSTWAWRIMCAPDIFSWNLCFLCLNAFHLIYIIYQMRPISFDPELEEAYHTLFRPFKVSILYEYDLVVGKHFILLERNFYEPNSDFMYFWES